MVMPINKDKLELRDKIAKSLGGDLVFQKH